MGQASRLLISFVAAFIVAGPANGLEVRRVSPEILVWVSGDPAERCLRTERLLASHLVQRGMPAAALHDYLPKIDGWTEDRIMLSAALAGARKIIHIDRLENQLLGFVKQSARGLPVCQTNIETRVLSLYGRLTQDRRNGVELVAPCLLPAFDAVLQSLAERIQWDLFVDAGAVSTS